MRELFVFNKTVIGQKHIDSNSICEDFSSSFSAEDCPFRIIAVADGHGDSACFRSNLGSKFAVETIIDCFKEFAKDATDVESYLYCALANRDRHKSVLSQLAVAIISKWYDKVQADICRSPFIEEDFSNAGDYKDFYSNNEKLTHIYGTTLIACLWLKDYIILLQQGDGRCDVFYDDGSVDQPIPWDERCQGNITTSMCDEDAAESMRWAVLDLKEKNVIACFLGSDGVEDSFRNSEVSQEGTHYFFRKLCCTFIDKEDINIEEYLDSYLREVSAAGSQDDVSVAGILNLDALKVHRNLYQKAMDRYILDVQREMIDFKIVSMTRKHGTLQKHVEKYKAAIDAKELSYKECETLVRNKDKELNLLKVTIAEKENELVEREIEHRQIVKLIEAKEENEMDNDEFYTKMKRLSSGNFGTQVKDMMLSWFDNDKRNLKELSAKMIVLEKGLNKVQDEKAQLESEIAALTEDYQNALSEFNEYDEKYSGLIKEKERIELEMNELIDVPCE